jgi:DedD protein
MQWLKDETIKHRVIGLAVLISIALVFVPAIVRKSNQRLDENMNLSLKLPAKPNFPQITKVQPAILLKTVKVAHVVIPPVVESKKTMTISPATSLSGMTIAQRSLIEKMPVLAHFDTTKSSEREVVTNHTVPANKKNAVSKPELFSVQLASFSQHDNAQTLVNVLNKRGYEASLDKLGGQYRVLVGQLGRLEATSLQKKLAQETQLKGFVVKAG